MAVLMRVHEEKRPVPDQREKVGPFLRRWLDEVARPTLRASTHASCDDILVAPLIPGLGKIALAKLTPTEVQPSGPTTRIVEYGERRLTKHVVEAARILSGRLGYQRVAPASVVVRAMVGAKGRTLTSAIQDPHVVE